jgi:hypothetical protein
MDCRRFLVEMLMTLKRLGKTCHLQALFFSSVILFKDILCALLVTL